MNEEITYRLVETAWGAARIARCETALTGFWFIGQKHETPVAAHWHAAPGSDPLLDAFELQLAEYAQGARSRFELPMAPVGTEFQQAVWQALLGIDYGTTVTYGAIAERVARPRAVRATGAAVGRNPLSIVIPCHRVIGGSGKLTGYAGGLERKAALLALEQGH